MTFKFISSMKQGQNVLLKHVVTQKNRNHKAQEDDQNNHNSYLSLIHINTKANGTKFLSESGTQENSETCLFTPHLSSLSRIYWEDMLT